MSISSAPMTAQAASVAAPVPIGNPTQSAVAAAAQPPEPAPGSLPSSPPVSPPANFSTDMRVDYQHQVYYAIVDDRTGDELYEIPPEALRNIGESLNVPLIGDSGIHGVDVKS